MSFTADGRGVKLGKGSLLLARLGAGDTFNGYDFMGNASALATSADITMAEIFSSTQQSAPLLHRAPTRTAFTMSVTLNEYQLHALSLFLLGENATATQTMTGSVAVPIANVLKGKYYDLGARQITNVVAAAGTDTLVAGVDYELNVEFGFIRFLPSSLIVVDAGTVNVTYDRPALTFDEIRIARVAAPICRLRYLADDANQDGVSARDEFDIWRVNVAPEGELNFIGDEYGSYQLQMSILSDSAHPADPFGKLRRVRPAAP